MKEKYLNKTVQVYAPAFTGGRALSKGFVTDVLQENVVVMTIDGTDIETAYYLSDGIRIEVVE